MKIALPFLCCFLGLSLGVNPAFADAVRLQILGPDGIPVVGAPVRIVESGGSWSNPKVETPLDLSSDTVGQIAFESKNSLDKKARTGVFEFPNSVYARISAAGMAVESQPLHAGDNKITLKVGGNWGGVALDENGKPVAGAKIVLGGFGIQGETKATYFPKELRLESVTGEDGKWSFSGVPRIGSARVQILDPRFVRETLNLSLDEAGAPPLFLERGAIIKGRLLAPDGTGAAGVALYPFSSGSSEDFGFEDFRTAPDGMFLISGLRAGTYHLQSINVGRGKSLPFILDPKNIEALQAGETRDVGDWNTKNGTLIKGKVVESGTGKPILNATVSFWGRGSGYGTSGENGEFTFRSADDIAQGNVSANGFVSVPQKAPAAANGTIDLGTVELKRGIEARGTIKDKDGHAAAQMQLMAQGKGATGTQEQEYAMSDEDGTFVFAGLAPGIYTLTSSGHKFASSASFTVTAGQKTPPIEVVLEGESAAATPQTIAGRALDGAEKPVAGAKISLQDSTAGRSSPVITIVSGVDGRFETRFALAGATPKVSKATRPGLVFARADDFKVVDGVWRADLTFRTRGAALRGKVVDAQGKPVARAYVSLAGRNDQPMVQSDENGAFSLPDVALEGITLIASNGRGYGETAIAKAGETSEIVLKNSVDYDATTLADEILPDARLGDLYGERWDEVWNALGQERLEAAILPTNKGDRNWEWTWNQYLSQLSRRDPKMFLARGDELIGRLPPNSMEAPVILTMLRARSENPADRDKARAWLETQAQENRGLNASGVSALLQMAVVAESLDAGKGARWLDFAAQIAAQLSEKGREIGAEEWGQSAAMIGPRAFEDLILEWGAKAQLNARHGALQTFVAAKNEGAAREMLSRMEKVLPAVEAIKSDVVPKSWEQTPKDFVAMARGEVAGLLVETDPKTAFQMAKDSGEARNTELLLLVGKNAARLGQTELATQALRQVFEIKYSNVEPGAQAAEIALGFDAKLADELFLKAWQKTKPRENQSGYGYSPSIATYAGARAKGWAGQSRILIEREWAERVKAYKPPTDNDTDSNTENLKTLVGAMAKIDARRALEMAAAMPGKEEDKAEVRGQIAVTLLGKE